MHKCYLILILSLLIAYSASADSSPWELEIEDKDVDIAIYYRKHNSGNIEFRGIAKVRASLNSLVSLLSDVDSMPDWVYNIEQAKVLKKVSDVEAYTYVVNTTHFPFSKRDSIVHTIISQDSSTLSVTINGQSVPDYIPESPDYVRLTLVKSFWQFKPLENGMVEVIFQGMGEPGGSIVADISHSKVFHWISKKLLWELPMISLKNMKQEIRKSKYHNKKYDFIREPVK
ncbi:MAG: START domain-containing protein [Gammaproteobacteria bacterium]|nr:START domain-containing protein [Gammaproteobacteria bacterium]